MTICGNNKLLNIDADYQEIDTSSALSNPDDTTSIVYIVALGLLGTVLITYVAKVYRCRKEIQEQWKWSREKSPTLGGSFNLMAKSALYAATMRLEMSKWEHSLRVYKLRAAGQSQQPSKSNYQSMRAATTDHVEKAARKAVKTLFTKYVQKGKILEIGANALSYDGKSYLCKLAPKERQKDFIFSDVFIPESLNQNQRKKYRQIDITNMSEYLKHNESYSNIVALSVFDTISRKQLPKIAEELSGVLKPGGRVVVLSDLLFDQGPFAEKYSEGDKFVLPIADKKILGAKIISIEKLKTRAKAFGGRLVSFLDNLLTLSPTNRFNYLMTSHKHLSLNIVSILGNMCSPSDYEIIDHRTSYTTDLRSAFEDSGLYKVLEDGYQSAKVEVNGGILVPSQVLGFNRMLNRISVDVSSSEFISLSSDHRLNLGKTELISKIYMMVLEKTS